MATITYDGQEIGFGSSTIVNSSGVEQEFYDSGFGAPNSISVDGDDYTNSAEAHFGDPYVSINIDVVQGAEGLLLSDDGGNILELRGDFRQIFESFRIDGDANEKILGPITAKFISASDPDLIYTALNGLPGSGTNLFISSNQKQMFLSTPSMLKGDYSLRLLWRNVITLDLPFTFTVVNRLRNDKVFSIRNNLPAYYDVGNKSDNYINVDQYYPQTESNLAVITSAFGTSFDSLYNSSYTVTTAKLKRGDNALLVETTLGFPVTGKLKLDSGETLTYTGKTETSFTGITGVTRLSEKGTRVQELDITSSKIDDYYKLQNNQFYVPSRGIRRDEFLNAFNIIDLNERSSEQVIFHYLYNIFKGINLNKTATISGTTVSSPTSGSWNNSHTQRICKINDRFYFIEGGDISGLNTLELDPIGCTYWTAADFDNGEYDIEVLPWIIKEDFRGKFTIELEKSCFTAALGYIDKDYIDFNIYIEGDDFDNNIKKNLNLDLFVAAGIIESFNFKRRSEDLFGTYFVQYAAPDGLRIIPDYEYN